eukprot:TRINITY_DN3546_c1_g1_i1.p1 TRINITY_DN3546_c1_g1~~TRINITY_DN3546_c1_g1_i1.p1  ORF type:complete len:256 (+),score=89.96 TRINITY_DN3546_c1_g1_i1:140-907(+)
MSQPIGIGRSSSANSSSGMLGSSPTQRKFLDIVDLSNVGFEVQMSESSMNELYVKLEVDPQKHPHLNVNKDSCPYIGGVWWLHIELPERYPQTSPSVGFVNRIFHPNVEEQSGSICLDVLNQTWSPMFTLTHAVCNFLTQLLCYPNPHDPMNGEAAAVLLHDEARFREKVAKHTATYATEEAAAESIAKETDGRDFYCPDASMLTRKGSRRAGAASSSAGATPENASLAAVATPVTQDVKMDDDDVSSASDIDLD